MRKQLSLRKLNPAVLLVWALMKPRRGVLALSLLLMAISRAAGLILPASTKYLVDDVFLRREIHLLYTLVGVVLLASVIQGVSSFSLTQLLSKSAQRMVADLSRQVQRHVARLPISFYDKNQTGVLLSRIMSDVEGVENLIGTGFVELSGGIMTGIISLVYLLNTSAKMTLLACAILSLFAVGLKKGFKAIGPIFHDGSKIHAEVTGRLTQSLSGVRVVKGFHAQDREADVYSAGVERMLKNRLRALTATSLAGLGTSIFTGVVSASIFLVGGHEVFLGKMTPGTFLTFTIFLALLVRPVFQIVTYGITATEALVDLERACEILNEDPEDANPARKVSAGHISGQVVFEHVDFAYDPGRLVLHDVCFEAQRGTVTALVGPSGAGKSTILGLIAAFYEPRRGRLLIDGKDLSSLRLDTYRTQLGVVLQETFLFDGTIRENVGFARPAASEREIRDACRIARVEEFADGFPQKYDTRVGERGIKLSGGQKQRISIARAILADPRILILDEATSSLDSESEVLIQESLRSLMRGRSTFVIAHRMSTIRCADQILVMEEGRLIERGTHDSLCANGGRYSQLYTKQCGITTNSFLTQRLRGHRSTLHGT